MKGFKIIFNISKVVLFAGVIVTLFSFLNLLLVPIPGGISGTNYREMKAWARSSENIDIAIIGTSRSYCSINTPIISEKLQKNVFNLSMTNGIYQQLYKWTVDMYELGHTPETVLIETSPALFCRALAEIDFQAVNPFEFFNYKDQLFSSRILNNIKYKTTSKPDAFYDETLSGLVSTPTRVFQSHGFWYDPRTFVNGNLGSFILGDDYVDGRGVMYQPEDYKTKCINAFKSIIELCKSKGSRVILYAPTVAFPVIGQYRDEYTSFLNYVATFADFYDIEHYDLSLLRNNIYEREGEKFRDLTHLLGWSSEDFVDVFMNFYNDVIKPGKEGASVRAESYLYRDCDELLDDNRFVYSLDATINRFSSRLLTSTITGTDVDVEYRYGYLGDDGSYIVFEQEDSLAGWTSSESFFYFDQMPTSINGLIFRVEARTAGLYNEEDETFEAFSEKPL